MSARESCMYCDRRGYRWQILAPDGATVVRLCRDHAEPLRIVYDRLNADVLNMLRETVEEEAEQDKDPDAPTRTFETVDPSAYL